MSNLKMDECCDGKGQIEGDQIINNLPGNQTVIIKITHISRNDRVDGGVSEIEIQIQITTYSEYQRIKETDPFGYAIELLTSDPALVEAFKKIFKQECVSPAGKETFWQQLCRETKEREEAKKQFEMQEIETKKLIKNGKKCRVYRVTVTAEYWESQTRLDLRPFIQLHGIENKEQLQQLKTELKEGDLVDTAGYRGQGLWYYNGDVLIATTGEYGYFLPPEAWKKVEEYGLQYFEDTGAEFVLIPTNYAITMMNKSSEKKLHHSHKRSGDEALSINFCDDRNVSYKIGSKEYSDTDLTTLY